MISLWYGLDTHTGARHLDKIRHGLDTGTRHFGKFGTPTQIYLGYRYTLHQNSGGAGICSVRLQYPTEHSGMVPYKLNTGTRYFGKLSTTSKSLPDASIRSVRPQYRYVRYRYPAYRYTLDHNAGSTGICSVRPQYPTEHSGMVWYDFNTGTRHFGKIGTSSIPVPDNSVSLARPPKIPQVPVYPTEHTLVRYYSSHQKLAQQDAWKCRHQHKENRNHEPGRKNYNRSTRRDPRRR